MRVPDIDLHYINAMMSTRLGIALVALGPMAVAIVNAARNDLLHRLDHVARYDHLTGVLRRGAFLDGARAMLAGLAAAGRPAAVLMIDIDHFKPINDRFGHAQGDRVLVAVAAALRSGLRDDAILGRMGGEEFAVLLPGIGAAEAWMTAEHLRLRVAALSLPGEDHAGGTHLPLSGLSASFGLSTCEAGRPQAWTRCWRRPMPRSTPPRPPGGTGWRAPRRPGLKRTAPGRRPQRCRRADDDGPTGSYFATNSAQYTLYFDPGA